MKVQIDKSYPMPGGADVAWALLRDIEAVAACMPGAKITERLDDMHYKGTVAVKLGPANLSFRGEIEVKGIDDAARRMQLAAKGTDSTGGSAASMDLAAHIAPGEGGTCALVGASGVTMSGKVAAFGARMMGPVSEQVLGQFAANFAARVKAAQEAKDAQAAAPAPAPVAEAPASAPAAAALAPPPAPMPEAKPLNGLALIWAILRDWLGSLFGTKKA